MGFVSQNSVLVRLYNVLKSNWERFKGKKLFM